VGPIGARRAALWDARFEASGCPVPIGDFARSWTRAIDESAEHFSCAAGVVIRLKAKRVALRERMPAG
jgi:hypothetical protein